MLHQILMSIYQIYKQQVRIQDSFIIYKRIIKDTNISYSEITIDFLKFTINQGKEDFATKIVFEDCLENKCNEQVISFYSKVLISL